MSKLIIITMLLIGLVGMIGTVVAHPQTTTVLGLVVDTSENEVAGAVVDVYSGTCCSGTSLGTYTTGSSSGTPGYYYIYIHHKLLEPDDIITVCAVHHTLGSGSVTTTAGADNSEGLNVAIETVTIPIPEFPTIALPIAAVLGLMFIISSRKKEE